MIICFGHKTNLHKMNSILCGVSHRMTYDFYSVGWKSTLSPFTVYIFFFLQSWNWAMRNGFTDFISFVCIAFRIFMCMSERKLVCMCVYTIMRVSVPLINIISLRRTRCKSFILMKVIEKTFFFSFFKQIKGNKDTNMYMYKWKYFIRPVCVCVRFHTESLKEMKLFLLLMD